MLSLLLSKVYNETSRLAAVLGAGLIKPLDGDGFLEVRDRYSLSVWYLEREYVIICAAKPVYVH